MCRLGPRPGGASTKMMQTPTSPWRWPSSSRAMLLRGRLSSLITAMVAQSRLRATVRPGPTRRAAAGASVRRPARPSPPRRRSRRARPRAAPCRARARCRRGPGRRGRGARRPRGAGAGRACRRPPARRRRRGPGRRGDRRAGRAAARARRGRSPRRGAGRARRVDRAGEGRGVVVAQRGGQGEEAREARAIGGDRVAGAEEADAAVVEQHDVVGAGVDQHQPAARGGDVRREERPRDGGRVGRIVVGERRAVEPRRTRAPRRRPAPCGSRAPRRPRRRAARGPTARCWAASCSRSSSSSACSRIRRSRTPASSDGNAPRERRPQRVEQGEVGADGVVEARRGAP